MQVSAIIRTSIRNANARDEYYVSDEEELEAPHANDAERENRRKRKGSQASNAASHPPVLKPKLGGKTIIKPFREGRIFAKQNTQTQ